MKRLFDHDPISKTTKWFHYDQIDGKCTIETVHDATAAVELTKAEFAATDERAPWKKEMSHAARVPLDIVADLMRSGVWYDDNALKKWLNDRNNSAFRVRPGKL